MPYALTVEPELVRTVFFGVMTAADLFAMAGEVRAIEQMRAVPRNRLTDLSQVTDIQLTVDDILAYVDDRRRFWHAHPLRSALVAPRALSLGFARMFQTFSEQAAVELFPTLAEAETWLAADAEPGAQSQERRAAPTAAADVEETEETLAAAAKDEQMKKGKTEKGTK